MPKRSKGTTWFLWALNAWFTAFWLVNILTAFFACSPEKAAWSVSGKISKHKCFNVAIDVLSLSIVGCFNDAVLVLVSLKLLWDAKMSRRSRAGALFIICLGSFVVAASTLRTFYVYSAYRSYDFTWKGLEILLWGQIEVCTGIFVSSLPALNGFIVRIHRRDPEKALTISTLVSSRWWSRQSPSTRRADSRNTAWDQEAWPATTGSLPEKQAASDLEVNEDVDASLRPWLEPENDNGYSGHHVPSRISHTSSVAGGGYEAYSSRGPLPPGAEFGLLDTFETARPPAAVTSNWITRNPTTTTIVALKNPQDKDEQPEDHYAIGSKSRRPLPMVPSGQRFTRSSITTPNSLSLSPSTSQLNQKPSPRKKSSPIFGSHGLGRGLGLRDSNNSQKSPPTQYLQQQNQISDSPKPLEFLTSALSRSQHRQNIDSVTDSFGVPVIVKSPPGNRSPDDLDAIRDFQSRTRMSWSGTPFDPNPNLIHGGHAGMDATEMQREVSNDTGRQSSTLLSGQTPHLNRPGQTLQPSQSRSRRHQQRRMSSNDGSHYDRETLLASPRSDRDSFELVIQHPGSTVGSPNPSSF
jgi:hypothetical protein